MAEANAAYSGSYDGLIKSLYEKIAGREGFKYQYSADPQYQAYRDNYTREGRRAMADSMAQAAHLTGGYGSSYSQRVGNEAYGSYLEKLNNALPELYNSAYQRYVDEGEALNRQLQNAMAMDGMEYQRYTDAQQMDFDREQFDYKKLSDSYDRLYEMVFNTGYAPSAEELSASGMSPEAAAALGYEFKRRNDLLPASGGGSGSGGGGGWSSYSSSNKAEESNKTNRVFTPNPDPKPTGKGSGVTVDKIEVETHSR